MAEVVDHPLSREIANLAVPEWARGVWRRERLAWAGGEDTMTRVLWVQTPLLYADLRVPAPGLPGEAEGFAGHLLVSGRICAWQRPVDVAPNDGPGDAGAMYRDGATMVECGIHANYLEDWHLEASAGRHLAATRGDVTLDGGEVVWPGDGPLEILVACEGHVIHALRDGRTAAVRHGVFDPSTGELEAVLRAGSDVAEAADMPWTLWSSTMTPVARDALLGSLAALS